MIANAFDAVAQVLPFALGVAISPIPIGAATLMLATPRARANGVAFLLGWFAGLALAGAVVLRLSDGSDDDGPAMWVSVLQIAIGVAAFAPAIRA